MKGFFDSRANRLGNVALQSVMAVFAIWQIGVDGPYQGLAITLLIPTSLLGMVQSLHQLKKYLNSSQP